MTTQHRISTPRGGRLPENPTIGDLKRYLARLVGRVDRGSVPVATGNCLSQICNVLINSIVDHELEARLDQLEADQASGRQTSSGSMTIQAGGTHETETPTGTA